jgi:hypothetical protein
MMGRHLCASADTTLDRLEELNRYTGDGVKQKIKTVPAILLNENVNSNKKRISITKSKFNLKTHSERKLK